MHIKKSVVFLAGGLGSRYQGLKQVDGILENGAPIIEYSLYDAIESGFDKFVFIISEAVPQEFIRRVSGILDKKKLEYHWIIQRLSDFVADPPENREKPWGTGHALLCAKNVIQENFLVINADDFYGPGSFERASQLIDAGTVTPQNYATIAFLLENTLSDNGSVSRGLCAVNQSGKLKSVEELTDIRSSGDEVVALSAGERLILNPEDLVSMNFWIFHPSIFQFLALDFERFLGGKPSLKSEFFLPEVIDRKIKKGEISVTVEQSHEMWKGITYPEDKRNVQQFLMKKTTENIYPENLWS